MRIFLGKTILTLVSLSSAYAYADAAPKSFFGDCKSLLGGSVARRESSAQKDSTYFKYARLFASTAGKQMADLALEYARRNPQKKVNVIVAMGGAEHIGNTIRLIAENEGLKNVRFVEMYLTTNIMQPWEGEIQDGDKKLRVRGTLPPTDPRIKITRPAFVHRELEKFHLERLRDLQLYFKHERAFDADHVVVVDTGTAGTAVNVVAQYAAAAESHASVEGVLIYHSGPDRVYNFAPVLSLNNGQRDGNFTGTDDSPTFVEFSPRWWAGMLDNEGPIGGAGGPFHQAFQRSNHGHDDPFEDRGTVRDNDANYAQSASYIRRTGFPPFRKMKVGALPFVDKTARQNYLDTTAGLLAGVEAR